ncbi:unnamed protein product [Bursaphelenchus okinawaensis]|uniref:Major facilitator superfamily (MFS) profile domain-containing protein n=1 Tax=Bursaphelenchus okinawaensis TaxID=465554 RepID=A0A811KCX5_9BILA|nr:unnamed protein product [Bursaphelenchus okinawaensis]CAG9099504.1 unnamed protein product [Bursaphelenchus okinawaensis]
MDEMAADAPILSTDSPRSTMTSSFAKKSPDQILSFFGPRNIFLAAVFAFMSVIWGLAAMPMMASAFFMGKVCTDAETNCTGTPGTVAYDFDLNGPRSYLADITTTAFLIGNAIGSSLITRLSDTRGRRPTLACSLLILGLSGSVSALSPNIYFFAVCRLIQGFFFAGCVIINWVLAYECCPHLLRPYTALVFGLMWVVGYCLLAPLDFLLQSWKPFMVALSIPSVFYAFAVQFWASESFHYCVTNQKKNEAVKFVTRCNKGAKVQLDPAELDHLFSDTISEGSGEAQRPTGNHGLFYELKRQKILIVYTIVLGYLWTCDAFIYYGLSLFSTELAGNRYLNFVLSGLVEAPSYLVSPLCLRVLGRRWFVALAHFTTAVAFFGVIFISNPTVYLILWLIGKFGIACALTALFVYASEVFPTTVRSGCIGFCSTVGRLGGALAPSVRLLGVLHPQLPNILFICMATVGGGITFILPETAGRELPDEAGESVNSVDDA